MGNHVGARLSRLIRERAYTAGALQEMDKQVEMIEAELSAAREKANDARARIEHLDQEITKLSAIEPENIRPIRAMPRIMKGAHGDFGRELIRILKEENGGTLEMLQMVRHMAAVFDLPMSTPEERERAGYLVRRRLNVFRKKGAVERMPTDSSNAPGLWRWKQQD